MNTTFPMEVGRRCITVQRVAPWNVDFNLSHLDSHQQLLTFPPPSPCTSQIYTAQPGSATITHCLLDIDLHQNEPRVIKLEKLPNDGTVNPDETKITEELGRGRKEPFVTGVPLPPDWHGAQVSVVIQGNYARGAGAYRKYILDYMRRLAIITPYAQLLFAYNDSDPDRNKYNCKILYRRTSEHEMPGTRKEEKKRTARQRCSWSVKRRWRERKRERDTDIKRIVMCLCIGIPSAYWKTQEMMTCTMGKCLVILIRETAVTQMGWV